MSALLSASRAADVENLAPSVVDVTVGINTFSILSSLSDSGDGVGSGGDKVGRNTDEGGFLSAGGGGRDSSLSAGGCGLENGLGSGFKSSVSSVK